MPPAHRNPRPCVAITMGDPCGVGPEIIVKAFSSGDIFNVCRPLVIGSPPALRRASDILGVNLDTRVIDSSSIAGEDQQEGVVDIISPVELLPEDIRYGEPTRSTCLAIISCIETAVSMAVAGTVQAVCTCPIHKANLHRYGFAFPGHTEFLRDLAGATEVVMMLAGPQLRVSLVTIHEALADVPKLLTRDLIYSTIRITAEALTRDFGLTSARIAVAGLNPHAGEEGRFGTEEAEIISPAIGRFHSSPYEVSGPYPPDTIFHRAFEGEFDAVVSMYHDQGLIPIKLVHFHDAVNVSLGLPIIRTSVDHGTAYDIAGTGKAHPGSLMEAVKLAAYMANNREKA